MAARRGPGGGPGLALLLLLLLAAVALLLGGPTGADGARPGPRGAGGGAPRRAASATRDGPGPKPAAAAVPLPVVIWHGFASSYRASDEGQAQWLQDLLEKAGVGYVVNVRIGKGGWKEDAYR